VALNAVPLFLMIYQDWVEE